jgi:hypothetical protein
MGVAHSLRIIQINLRSTRANTFFIIPVIILIYLVPALGIYTMRMQSNAFEYLLLKVNISIPIITSVLTALLPYLDIYTSLFPSFLNTAFLRIAIAFSLLPFMLIEDVCNSFLRDFCTFFNHKNL